MVKATTRPRTTNFIFPRVLVLHPRISIGNNISLNIHNNRHIYHATGTRVEADQPFQPIFCINLKTFWSPFLTHPAEEKGTRD
mmetsp:Transcript_40851/g.68488  ORF Transcript_40851/g.68488 Transcript_40851/m.68488 type:complete len:83 (-) Transcript_40851:615-863(-)